MIPEHVAVQTNRAARAFVFDQTGLVNWKNLRVSSGEPNWWSCGGCGEHDLNASLAEDVHHSFQPAEIIFAIFLFAKAPDELPYPNHINAGTLHQLGVAFPSAFGVVLRASVRINPLLRVIINAEIHINPFACGRFSYSRNSVTLRNLKKASARTSFVKLRSDELLPLAVWFCLGA